MRASVWYSMLMATAVCTAPVQENSEDDDCSQVWITVGEDLVSAPATSTVIEASSVAQKQAERPIATKLHVLDFSTTGGHRIVVPFATSVTITSPTSSTDSEAPNVTTMPELPDGTPAFPLNGDHLKAPAAEDPVPHGAAVFTPADGKTFNCSAFAEWIKHQRDEVKLPSKFLKIAPGTYRYQLGPVMPDGTDPNTVQGENIVLYLLKGGWTVDFRDVTFYIDITPENQHRRPSVMIYCLQSEDMTILGGTIWIDQGEQWTQARITALAVEDSAGNRKATFEVERGYNVSAWKNAGPRNQNCVDDSDSDHYTRPGCNFWKVQDYNFDALMSKHTFTATILGGSGLEKGYIVSMQVGPNSAVTLSTEDNGGLHVKGLTSNGYMMQIGLNGADGGKSAVFEDVWYVNPPSRPGFAPKVQGPVLNWGNLEGFNYDQPGQAKSVFVNSWWQTTGCEKDIQTGNNATMPVN